MSIAVDSNHSYVHCFQFLTETDSFICMTYGLIDGNGLFVNRAKTYNPLYTRCIALLIHDALECGTIRNFIQQNVNYWYFIKGIGRIQWWKM